MQHNFCIGRIDGLFKKHRINKIVNICFYFIAAWALLCFALVDDSLVHLSTLVAEKCLDSLRAFPLSPNRLSGGGQRIGRAHSRDSGPQLITEVSHSPRCHAQHDKPKARKRKEGCWHVSSQVTTTRAEALLPWKWLHTCLLVGSKERIPCFAVLH